MGLVLRISPLISERCFPSVTKIKLGVAMHKEVTLGDNPRGPSHCQYFAEFVLIHKSMIITFVGLGLKILRIE